MNTSSRQARALRLLLAQVASADEAIACCHAADAFFCRILGSPAEDIASMRWLHGTSRRAALLRGRNFPSEGAPALPVGRPAARVAPPPPETRWPCPCRA